MGDRERALLEIRNARLERQAAKLELDRADLLKRQNEGLLSQRAVSRMASLPRRE